MATNKPTNKFSIPTSTVFKDLDGKAMTEPGPEGGTRSVTLGLVLGAAMLSDAKPEGVTLSVLDRLELARKFRDKDCEIKVTTCAAVKAIVAAAYAHAPIIAGQALELLGDEPNDL